MPDLIGRPVGRISLQSGIYQLLTESVHGVFDFEYLSATWRMIWFCHETDEELSTLVSCPQKSRFLTKDGHETDIQAAIYVSWQE